MAFIIDETSDFKCDGPSCTMELHWSKSELKGDLKNLPEPAFRIITVAPFYGMDPVGFCSKGCLLLWMRDYVPPKSPKQEFLEKEAEKTNVVPINTKGLIYVPDGPTD